MHLGLEPLTATHYEIAYNPGNDIAHQADPTETNKLFGKIRLQLWLEPRPKVFQIRVQSSVFSYKILLLHLYSALGSSTVNRGVWNPSTSGKSGGLKHGNRSDQMSEIVLNVVPNEWAKAQSSGAIK